MTRETKLGLLIGTGIILIIGIVVSDHLSAVHQQQAPPITYTSGNGPSLIDSDPGSGMVKSPKGDAGNASGTDKMNMPGDAVTPRDSNQSNPQIDDHSNSQGTAMTMNIGEPAFAYSTGSARLTNSDGTARQAINQQAGMNDRGGNGDAIPFVEAPRTTGGTPHALGMQTGNTQYVQQSGSQAINTRDYKATGATKGTIHYVKSGETLWDIANTYYGDGHKWNLIAAANPGAVGAKGSVRPGVRLVIPDKASAANGHVIVSGVNNTMVKGVAPATATTITVASGDTLSDLSSKYLGTKNRWHELLDANKDQLKSPRDLQVGMKLHLPANTATSITAVKPTVVQLTTIKPTAVNVIKTAPSTRPYTVQRGDTLFVIAKKTLGSGHRWHAILDSNKALLHNDPRQLQAGQLLTIPGR